MDPIVAQVRKALTHYVNEATKANDYFLERFAGAPDALPLVAGKVIETEYQRQETASILELCQEDATPDGLLFQLESLLERLKRQQLRYVAPNFSSLWAMAADKEIAQARVYLIDDLSELREWGRAEEQARTPEGVRARLLACCGTLNDGLRSLVEAASVKARAKNAAREIFECLKPAITLANTSPDCLFGEKGKAQGELLLQSLPPLFEDLSAGSVGSKLHAKAIALNAQHLALCQVLREVLEIASAPREEC